MKYIAIIDEEMLDDFRIDEPILCNGMSVNDKVMVVTDKLGFTRGIQLKPLPKEHGRLIDADALIEHIKKSRCIDCNSVNGVRCRACQYDDEMADIDDAPTIIEA